MAVKLTERQQQILELIRSEITRTGFPPTRAEIARALGFKSANAAEDHLKALAKKGAIELTAGASRGIRLVDADPATGRRTGMLEHASAALTQLLVPLRSEEHTSELQSLMRISYAVLCLKKKIIQMKLIQHHDSNQKHYPYLTTNHTSNIVTHKCTY